MENTERQHGLWFHILDVVFNIVVIVAIVAGIRTFLVSPFQVEGTSMINTLEDSEYIVINKLAYFIGTPERGDIVVLRPPNTPNKYYVKRVIGMPGDTVILREGNVFIKKAGETAETKLVEPYLDERNQGKTFRDPPTDGNGTEQEFVVPAKNYFVMGDNRQGSLDSRSFRLTNGDPEPFVPQKNIKGRVWFVALPITKIHAISHATYELP